jgi:crotonobetainyl-CoA:carnitine CoA-transferase CaiB-like acyl-CoA transferase
VAIWFSASLDAHSCLAAFFPQSIVPYQAFSAKDGYMILAAMNDRQFQSLLAALSLDELGSDERFATNAARVANR